jgi:hypothetical protein
VEIGLDRRSFDDRWRAMREEYRESSNWSRTAERRLEIFIHQLRMLVEGQRVVLCAALLASRAPGDFAPAPEDDEGVGDPDPLMAGCAISIMSKTELASEVALTADAVLLAYTASRPDEESHFVNLEPPCTVELGPAGRAVHLVRLLQPRSRPGDSSSVFAETFLVPISEGDALCVIQFSTPNTEDATDFSLLFNAIARTLRVFYEDTATIDPEPVG